MEQEAGGPQSWSGHFRKENATWEITSKHGDYIPSYKM
jgi:hypothetical protein